MGRGLIFIRCIPEERRKLRLELRRLILDRFLIVDLLLFLYLNIGRAGGRNISKYSYPQAYPQHFHRLIHLSSCNVSVTLFTPINDTKEYQMMGYPNYMHIYYALAKITDAQERFEGCEITKRCFMNILSDSLESIYKALKVEE